MRAESGERTAPMIDAFRTNGNSPPAHPDIIVEQHGSIVILRGVTHAGHAGIEEHVSSEGYQPFGAGTRLAEPRYVPDIVSGAIDDGLLVP
jgi:hypothetical protein